MRTVAAWLAVLCLALVAPAAAQDKQTIEKLNDDFVAAFNSGNYGAVAAMYTEDAFLLPPGAELMRGRAAIQAFWTNAGGSVGDIRLKTVEVTPLGEAAAREIGTFTLKTKGAQSAEVAGKYVVVWQKVGGNWKLATDIWNSNKP
jgi:uncharacterized protein (TIGR02246 family)